MRGSVCIVCGVVKERTHSECASYHDSQEADLLLVGVPEKEERRAETAIRE